MKEEDQFICRVLFYHHHCDNIYHVYTDQMLPLTCANPPGLLAAYGQVWLHKDL